MSTPAISNVFSVLPTPANGRQDGNGADAGAFNQVLSREMTEPRAAARSPERTPSERASTEAAAKKEKTPAAGDGKSGKDSPPASTEAASAEGGKVADEENGTVAADAPADDTDVDPAAAAELAAFLAAMTQANPQPGTAATEETALLPTDTKGAAAGKSVDAEGDSLTATLAANGKQEATGKGEDFVAALEKAAAPADGGKSAATAMKAEVDKAVTQAVKAIETPAPAAPQQLAATSAASTLQQLDQLQAQQANRLLPQVGTQDWNQALGQKVVWMVQGVQQSATLTLNPPDLGPMQVTVNVQHNQATASFTAPQPEVRQALEAAMPRLREMLNEAGIQLGQSSVSAGSSSQQGNGFADAQHQGRGSDRHASAETTPTVGHVSVRGGGTGMVDTFA